jgi:hypothetical protein
LGSKRGRDCGSVLGRAADEAAAEEEEEGEEREGAASASGDVRAPMAGEGGAMVLTAA